MENRQPESTLELLSSSLVVWARVLIKKDGARSVDLAFQAWNWDSDLC